MNEEQSEKWGSESGSKAKLRAVLAPPNPRFIGMIHIDHQQGEKNVY
jgi:hypothetical protein